MCIAAHKKESHLNQSEKDIPEKDGKIGYPLDISRTVLYIIRYKCSAKECTRIVLLQQAGG